MLPKRILHVTSVLNYGGIENLILNVFKNIDREKISFDFLVLKEDNGILEDEIRALGGTIHKLPSIKKTGYFKFKKNLNYFFKCNPQYSIVHSHVNTLSGIVLECAKEQNVPVRIAHAHTAYPEYGFFEGICKNFFKRKVTRVSTDLFACSTEAGNWLFGKETDFRVLLNGVDTEKFSFSQEKRDKARKELNIQNKFVIINVGRFSKEKNHLFLLSVFEELLKIRKDSYLICVGDGKLKNRFQEKIKELNMQEVVLITGASSNVSYYLNASDVYVSPSLFEGFGSSAAEAQFNSLPCVLSDKHPQNINFTGNCNFLPCTASPKSWAEEIHKSKRKKALSDTYTEYSIQTTSNILSDFYLSK